MESVKILVTLDKNYLLPLQVMLTSLYYNNPGEKIEIYLMHKIYRIWSWNGSGSSAYGFILTFSLHG